MQPSRIFESVSAELFESRGHHYLAYTDRYSGYPTIVQWQHDPSASQVISAIRHFFTNTGVPTRFQSDGRPQFNGKKFREFLKRWGVEWARRSIHYPQSNGHAETNVKKLKELILKMSTSDAISDEFQDAMIELRNMPGPDGRSPNEIVFGHNMHSRVPIHYSSFAQEWQTKAEQADRKRNELAGKMTSHYNRSAHNLPTLQVGQEVRIQDHATQLWTETGTIVGRGKQQDYLIKSPSGRTHWWNRRFLHQVRTPDPLEPIHDHPSGIMKTLQPEDKSEAPAPFRRNQGTKKVRFRIDL